MSGLLIPAAFSVVLTISEGGFIEETAHGLELDYLALLTSPLSWAIVVLSIVAVLFISSVFLNFLDVKCHQAYDDYQNIFRRIVKEGQITDDTLEDIYGMMLDIFYYDYYHIRRRYGDLSKFEEYTYADMQLKEDISQKKIIKSKKRHK